MIRDDLLVLSHGSGSFLGLIGQSGTRINNWLSDLVLALSAYVRGPTRHLRALI